MPKLTTNYSKALIQLICSGDTPIDEIEVGPWFTPEQIGHFHEELPEWRFQLHASSFISRLKYRPRALHRLHEYLSCTQSRWISIHLELLPLHVYLLSSRFGIHLKPPSVENAKNGFLQLLSRIQDSTDVPIILENLASLPVPKYVYAANPEIISEIIRVSGSGFLLDIPHARVAASYQEVDVRNYLERLPLELIKQVHVSGVRAKNGVLYDAHDSMQVEDFAILEWVLERSNPQVVTLEYYREADALREQLLKLRTIIDGSPRG